MSTVVKICDEEIGIHTRKNNVLERRKYLISRRAHAYSTKQRCQNAFLKGTYWGKRIKIQRNHLQNDARHL